MSETILPLSPSLGFWVRHQDAMLAFEYGDDEEDPVPEELRTIFADERYRPLLVRILDVSNAEGNALVHAIANDAAKALALHPKLSIERRRKAYEWTEKFLVRRKRARSGNSVEVGFYLETNAQLGVTLYAYAWTKGGKSAAEFNARCLREISGCSVLKGADDKTRYWANGVVLLTRIALRDFMTDAGDLETRRLLTHVTTEIGKCTGEAFAAILERR